MGCCNKCGSSIALVLIVIGVLFLLQDRGVWDFWGLSWYTVLFLFFGVMKWGCSSCKDCKACCAPTKGKKK